MDELQGTIGNARLTSRRKTLKGLWAVMLTAVSPGLGLIYAGRWGAGVVFNAFSLLAAVAIIASVRLCPPTPGLVAMLLVVAAVLVCLQLATTVYVALSAVRGTLRRGRPGWLHSTSFAAIILLPLQFGIVQTAHRNWASFSIRSRSMLPALQPGDVVIADLRPPTAPRRGDIFIFRRANGDKWVKRVIGLPGDSVSLGGGVLSINNIDVARTDHRAYRGPALRSKENDTETQPSSYTERLPGGAAHSIATFGDDGMYETFPQVKVPDDSYFVLGDNRDNSLDSRMPEVGFIPRSALVGRASTILFSLDRTRILQQVQ